MKHRLRMLGYQGLDILSAAELRRLYYEEILLSPKRTKEFKCINVTIEYGRKINTVGDAV